MQRKKNEVVFPTIKSSILHVYLFDIDDDDDDACMYVSIY